MLTLKLLFKEIYQLLTRKHNRIFLYLAFRFGSRKRYKSLKTKVLGYHLEIPDALSFIWQFKEIFADESYQFIALDEKPLIYDCGANIGISCLYFKHKYPKATIRAFEVDPKIAEILQKNLQNNGIQDIEIIAKAVWVNSNGIEIKLEGADNASIFAAGEKVKIDSVRLADELAKESHIDLLKMDIEGAETAVLKDCKNELHKIQNIFVEYHAYLNQPQSLHEILAIFTENGFRYFIWNPLNRLSPFVHQAYKNNPQMDLQLNIFAYK